MGCAALFFFFFFLLQNGDEALKMEVFQALGGTWESKINTENYCCYKTSYKELMTGCLFVAGSRG